LLFVINIKILLVLFWHVLLGVCLEMAQWLTGMPNQISLLYSLLKFYWWGEKLFRKIQIFGIQKTWSLSRQPQNFPHDFFSINITNHLYFLYLIIHKFLYNFFWNNSYGCVTITFFSVSVKFETKKRVTKFLLLLFLWVYGKIISISDLFFLPQKIT
jgi:hypothetical protein